MKLSTKGRHAVTAMMELALQHKTGPVTLADISAQQSISISYLEQLFARLRQHGLVTGMRGTRRWLLSGPFGIRNHHRQYPGNR